MKNVRELFSVFNILFSFNVISPPLSANTLNAPFFAVIFAFDIFIVDVSRKFGLSFLFLANKPADFEPSTVIFALPVLSTLPPVLL